MLILNPLRSWGGGGGGGLNILCLPNLVGSIAKGRYVISIEDAKLQNLIVEPVFFFCALQSIRYC